MTLKLVQSERGCGTKQQTSRDNTASGHDGSQGENLVLDPVDYLKVVHGKNGLRLPAGHCHYVSHCLVCGPQ
ncbi:hypothetical protein E2C01_056047 [Portunus trituberculatus]|uniref:Uncharacterized protein n=1 Tax=Portunus trituberculatus TaxID=210409 RepID=A0A5B7GYK9_PORTR|nr:hypothetical protein [Portunus trituberculatus]